MAALSYAVAILSTACSIHLYMFPTSSPSWTSTCTTLSTSTASMSSTSLTTTFSTSTSSTTSTRPTTTSSTLSQHTMHISSKHPHPAVPLIWTRPLSPMISTRIARLDRDRQLGEHSSSYDIHVEVTPLSSGTQ
eukprot:1936434-Amphidinium_carterae.1